VIISTTDLRLAFHSIPNHFLAVCRLWFAGLNRAACGLLIAAARRRDCRAIAQMLGESRQLAKKPEKILAVRQRRRILSAK